MKLITYDYAKISDGYFTLCNSNIKYPVVEGKHCYWIPSLEIKIIKTIKGKLPEFQNGFAVWDKRVLKSIEDELHIMKYLAKNKLSPNIGKLLYFKTFIIDNNFVYYDCMGVYGYEMKDANKIKGNFTWEKFKEICVDEGKVKLSKGSEGDIKKKDNIVNDNLIDIRRTYWDMTTWTGEKEDIPFYKQSKEEIKEYVKKYGQFPPNMRDENYESYFLVDEYVSGIRDTLYRLKQMKIESVKGKSLLDLGCQIGSMCIELYRRGADNITGIDYNQDFIDCARMIARENKFPINYFVGDLTDYEIIDKINNLYPEGVDIVFALSLYSHIGENLWTLLRYIKWETCYLETNNVGDDYKNNKNYIAFYESAERLGKVTFLGLTKDRSPRVILRVDK